MTYHPALAGIDDIFRLHNKDKTVQGLTCFSYFYNYIRLDKSRAFAISINGNIIRWQVLCVYVILIIPLT